MTQIVLTDTHLCQPHKSSRDVKIRVCVWWYIKKYKNSSQCGETASSLRYDRWELTWNVLLCVAQSRPHKLCYNVLYEK